MLIIRLQRVGKKNSPSYRIVLAQKHKAVKKDFVELLGHYDPRTKKFGLKNPERLQYWVKQKVQLSPTIHNLLINQGVLTGKKVEAWKPKKKTAEASASTAVPTTATANTEAKAAPPSAALEAANG